MVVGRDEQGDWLLVTLPGGEDVAWAAARYLDLSGDDPAGLPVTNRLSQARVVSGARGYKPSTGLSGTLVFQTASGGPIMVYDLASGTLRQLTTGLDPAISPDGQTVAFIRDGGGDSGLYLIGIDGGNERRIFIESKLRTPAWSPDGAHIAFSRVAGQDTCRAVGHGICLPDAPWLGQFPLRVFDVRRLSQVDATGGSFSDIPSEKQAFAPDWGDDGIVYQSQAGIQLARGDDSRPILLDGRYSDPVWRPDSSAIAFVSLEKDHREIFRVNSDGSGLIALTHPGDFIEDPRALQHVAPAWSPDGGHIVYLSDESGDWALYVMDADGGNARKLPIDATTDYQFQGEQVVDWGR
jgi:dipeptidyl aminopeptidase/acylaminoacyl peptidase